MNLQAIFHEAKSRYAYAYDRETIHLRVRTGRGELDAVTFIGGDAYRWLQSPQDPTHWEWDKASLSYEAMQLECSTELFDYWFIAIKPRWFRLRYAFILHQGELKTLFGCRAFYDLTEHPEFQYEQSSYFNFPYLNHEDIFTAPDWVKDTVWYQIFPDRYDRGPIDLKLDGSVETSNVFKVLGGNLQGIIDHLDELQDLGINGLYLTPIFASPTSHKYDTSDYYEVDPGFGSKEVLVQLVSEAHRRGIRVMLDAVFNHCGWFHPFWQDVVKNGHDSKYYECFYVTHDPVINFEVKEGQLPRLTQEQCSQLNYLTFAFTPLMPKWNTSHPLVREYLLGAIRYWTELLHIDGWRLDVANEVSHDFWREFRRLVKGIDSQIYILGENWDNSYPWLMGDQFDAVMNYEFSYCIWNLFRKGDDGQIKFDVRMYQEAVNQYLVSYPRHNLAVMYNMVDSHDTVRIRHLCADQVEKVKLAYVLEMTFTGAPSIYYGSEVGLGGDQSHNRAVMPWESTQRDLDLRQFIQRLIHLRHQYGAFRSVEITWLVVNSQQNCMIFKKTASGQVVYVMMNASDQIQRITLPEEMADRPMIELLWGGHVDLGNTQLLSPLSCQILLRQE